jgi:hypothetical protein
MYIKHGATYMSLNSAQPDTALQRLDEIVSASAIDVIKVILNASDIGGVAMHMRSTEKERNRQL